jgi:hypothetical protein
VREETSEGPDWRDAAAYAPLLDADRSLFAWEWLRRDAGYRVAAGRSLSSPGPIGGMEPGPEHFGLVAFEPPGLAVPDARPVWHSATYPYVLGVRAAPAMARQGEPDLFDPRHVRALARLIERDGAQHLLLSDGLRCIRLDGPAGTFRDGPVCLSFAVCGIASAEPRLLTLRRFLALCRAGRFSRGLHRAEMRARRWILMLRAWDATAAGATQRDIAETLLRPSAGGPRWRTREPSARSQAQRLVRSARALVAGGYRAFLR